MVPEIQLLAFTSPKWEQYLSGTMTLLKRSVTSSLDAKKLPVGNLFSYIASLAEYRQPNDDIENVKLPTDHLFFTFLVAGDLDLESWLWESGLSVLGTRDRLPHLTCILSGTLTKWVRAIEYGLNESSPYDLRILCGKLYLAFSQQGLSSLWPAKHELDDGSFILR